jgi:GTP pyrophosphokinase
MNVKYQNQVKNHIKILIDKAAYLTKNELKLFKQAILFAQKMHRNQYRLSGEPYIVHVLAVAEMIADLKLDINVLIAALLHDVLEDTNCSPDSIYDMFGQIVLDIVLGLTKIKTIENNNKSDNENLRKFLLAVAHNPLTLVLKLADRLHNMRTLDFHNPEKRRKIAQNTIDVYAPMSERIGLHAFKNELYDLAFAELHLEVRNFIVEQINLFKKNNIKIETVINEFKSIIVSQLPHVKIEGREKTPFAIWTKMEEKQTTFDQLSDIFAIRIITENIGECYIVLGIIHTHYPTLPRYFQDYISNPKVNGYQSIHTSILGPNNESVEIQIRTLKMHQIAEYGIAAHWAYKQKIELDIYQSKLLNNIREMIDNASADNIIYNTKLVMYYDQVFCFSVDGQKTILPKNSTPLDFAFYNFNTNMVIKIEKIFINNQEVDIYTKLQNGDIIKLVFGNNNIRFNKKNYDIVQTLKAKTEIKKLLQLQKRQESTIFGTIILHQYCNKYKLNYKELPKKRFLVKIFHNPNILQNLELYPGQEIYTPNIINLEDYDNSQIIKIATHCCKPEKGCAVIGIKIRHNIIIHRQECINVNVKYHRIDIVWHKNNFNEHKLHIEFINQKNFFSWIINFFYEINIKVVETKTTIILGDLEVLNIGLNVNKHINISKIIELLKKREEIKKIIHLK